jgi:CSLREA domain-containing protein
MVRNGVSRLVFLCCLVALSTLIFGRSLAQDVEVTENPTEITEVAATPTDLPTDIPVPTATDVPTAVPTDTPVPIPTDEPSATPSDTPSETPLPSPTVTAEITATQEPIIPPPTATTEQPTVEVTEDIALLNVPAAMSMISDTPGCTYEVAADDPAGLITAVEEANATPEADTICLGGGTYTLTAIYGAGTYGNNGLPAITTAITINGNGATITRSSATAFRLFEINSSGSLTVHDARLTNGTSSRGGAIFADGYVTLDRVTVSGNTATSEGGGLFQRMAHLTIQDSTFSGNSGSNGGGISLTSGATIKGSTFENNAASGGLGGAINGVNAVVLIQNSTFSSNSTGSFGVSRGGAISGTQAEFHITLSTFYHNISLNGDTFYGSGSTQFLISNSIITGDIAASCAPVDSGIYVGESNIGDDTSCGGAVVADPLLGPLQDNGGLTLTHALLAGSSAIDAAGLCFDAGNSAITTDQRGHLRYGACDIGSYEYGDAAPDNRPVYIARVLTQPSGLSHIDVRQFYVTFSEPAQNPDGDSTMPDVTNLMGYRLVSDGANNVHETTSCAGPGGDDGAIIIDSVSYDDAANKATLSVNAGAVLPADTYRLRVCSVSIQDFDGNSLDGNFDGTGGDDYVLDLTTQVTPPLTVADQWLYAQPNVSRSVNVSASHGFPPYTYVVHPPANGTLTGTAPTLTYKANAGYSGLDTFTVDVTDSSGAMRTGTVQMFMGAALTGLDLSLAVYYQTPLLTTLSASGGAAPYTFAVTVPTMHGVLNGTAPNLTYTPNAGYSGPDSFSFLVTDANGYKDAATANISVGSPLSLANQTLSVRFNTFISFSYSAIGGAPPYTYNADVSLHGVVTGTAPTLTYTPNTDYSGTDTISIGVTDALGNTASAVVTVNIPTPIPIMAGNMASLIAALNAANANPDPDTIYLPSGTYILTAINNATAERGANGLPVINTDILIRGSGSPTIMRSGAAQFRIFEITRSGALTLDGVSVTNGDSSDSFPGGGIFNAGRLVLYQSTVSNNRGWVGGGIFNEFGNLTVDHSRISGNTAAIDAGGIYNGARNGTPLDTHAVITDSLIIGNSAPSFFGGSGRGGGIFSTAPLTVSGSVIANNNSTAEGDAFFIGNGSILVNNNCIVGNLYSSVYKTPSGNIANFQSNWWGASGGPSQTSVGVFIGDSISTRVNASNALTAGILGCPTPQNLMSHTPFQQALPIHIDAPIDGIGPFTYAVNSTPSNGVLNGTLPDVTFTPAAGFAGTTSFTYRVTDSMGLSGVGVVNITVVPKLVAANLNLGLASVTPLPITLSATGGTTPYIFAITSSPQHGTLSGAAPDIIYTSENGYLGVDSFAFSVTDADGIIANGSVTITVQPLTATNQTVNTPYNTSVNITLAASGGQFPLTFGPPQVPAHGTVIGTSPLLTYIPDAGYTGADSFNFTVGDIGGNTLTSTVTINVGTPPAAVIAVNSTADDVPFVNNGNCTLGEAIQAANTDTTVDGCAAGSGADIIELPAGQYDISTPISAGAQALPTISSVMTIRGAGMDNTVIKRTGSAMTLIGVASGTGNLTLQNLALVNGGGYGSTSLRRGGAIFNSGTLMVLYTRFEDNWVYNDGGAIYNNSGTTTITNSVFLDNRSEFRGGALFNLTGATMIVKNSVFFDNKSGLDGNTLTSFGPTTFTYSCILDSYNNRNNLVYGGSTSYTPDATRNWWGPPGNFTSQLGFSANPLLSTRPRICDALGSVVPSLTIAAGDVNGLIAAMQYANTLPYATIELAANSTYTVNGLFNNQFMTDKSALPEITGSVTINGNGATITRSDPANARILSAYFGHLTLNNLSISGGRAAQGAGVRVYNGSLNINQVTFSNNTKVTTGDLVRGGAVYGWGSSVNITNSTFNHNTSNNGGAISSFNGSLEVVHNVFTGNSADAGSSIAVMRGNTVSISDNCFVGNSGSSVYTDDSNNSGVVINAANNWWGASNGPSGGGTGAGDAIGPRVTYTPFLTSRPSYCPSSPLVAQNQTLELPYYRNNLDISLSASGGTPPYSFGNFGAPTHGTLTSAGAVVTYTPALGFTGSDSFTFDVTDDDGQMVSGTITISVTVAQIVVNSTAQEIPFLNNANCTLGEAIQAANTDTAVDDCPAGSGDDIIELVAGIYTLDVIDNDTDGPNGLPVITSDIAINGNGATITRSAEVDTPQFRIFHVTESGALELTSLMISGGRLERVNYDTDRGGGIYNLGRLSLDDVTISNNRTSYNGGGVYSVTAIQPLLVSSSTFVDNYSGAGGGIDVCGASTITSTVFTNNSADYGGAIYSSCSYGISLTASVVTGNSAMKSGGGIYNQGTGFTVTNSILIGNTAPSGSSIQANQGPFQSRTTVHNSCIVDHSASAVYRQTSSSYLDLTNNWWGSTSGPGGDASGFGSTLRGWNVASDTNIYTPFLTTPLPGCEAFGPRANDRQVNTGYETAVAVTFGGVDGISPYSFGTISTPMYGSITGSAPDVTYTPNAGFSGIDTFTYEIIDSGGNTDTGMVKVTVAPVLTAGNLTFNTFYHTNVGITLTATGGRTSYLFAVQSAPAHGTLTGIAPAIVYHPETSFSGIDTLTYSVTDANGTTSNGLVTVNVGEPITGADLTLTTYMGTGVPTTLKASGGTPPYIFGGVTQPEHGAVIGSGMNLTYIPRADFAGTDSFTYTVTDHVGDAAAATVTVTISSTALEIASGSVTSLIAAVEAANASATETTIILADATYILSVDDVIPAITGDVTLNGDGAEIRRIAGDSTPVLTIANGGSLTVNDLTISGGGSGGLVNYGGTLLVTNSTIAHNSSGGSGGGVANLGGTSMLINSTISNNDATRAGGVYVDGGVVTLTNSTIASNEAGQGGGIVRDGGTVILNNTIVADNTPVNCVGAITSKGHNIDGDASCDLMGTGDLSNADPQLLPLSDNGGPTFTHALAAQSVALEHGDNAACYWADQRGKDRPLDSNGDGSAVCEVGAYEYLPSVAPSQVTLIEPADETITIDSTPTFVWNALPSAASYNLQLSRSASFSQIAADFYATGPEYTPSSNLVDSEYYWRVRGVNAGNIAGVWSLPRKLVINTAGPTGVVSLTSPANHTIVNTTRPTFSWIGVSGASSYRLQVDDDPYFDSPQVDTIVSSLSYGTAALPQGTYHWRVIPRDTWFEEGLWSASFEFSNTIRRAPENNSFTTDTTPTFQWYALTGQTYRLEVDNTPDFSSVDYRCGFISNSSCTPSLALSTGRYYWRVTIAGIDTGSPPMGVFTITSVPPSPPSLLGPVNNAFIGNNAPTLSWNPMTGAVSYELQFDNLSTFASPEYIGSAAATFKVLPPLADGRYYWRVRSLNTLGAPGAWSSYRSLTIDTAAPGAPALRTPLDPGMTTDTTPYFTWGAVSGASRYQVRVNGLMSFESALLASTSFTVPAANGMPFGNYTWQVKAIDAAGNQGAWSSSYALAVTNLYAPKNGASLTDLTPTFQWVAVSGGRYQLQVTTAADYLDNQQFDSPVYTCSSPGTTTLTNCTPTQRLAAGVYYWRVGVNGSFNAVVFRLALSSSSLPAAPSLLTVNGMATNDSTPSLSWSPVSAAVTYELQVDDETSFASPDRTYIQIPSNIFALPLPLMSERRYYWRARAVNGDGAAGAWSGYRSFIYDSTPTAPPVLRSPANNASTSDSTPTLSWTTVTGGVRYRLQIADDDAFAAADLVVSSIDISGSSYTASTLLDGDYYWRVRAVDAAGNLSGWSTARKLHIDAP